MEMGGESPVMENVGLLQDSYVSFGGGGDEMFSIARIVFF